jgi:hypothetical protein
LRLFRFLGHFGSQRFGRALVSAAVLRGNRGKQMKMICHARACPGHPRLEKSLGAKAWMAGHGRAEATPFFERLCLAMTRENS